MILITGCAGYIGSRLAEKLLSDGLQVRGLILPDERERVEHLVKQGLTIWEADLLKQETLDGISKDISIVYHLAGGHFSSVRRMEELYIEGTKRLLEIFKGSGIKACFIASNGAAYGDCGDEIIKEDHKMRPTHPFGEITLKMEKQVLDYYEKYDFPAMILRIGEVYGSAQYNFLKASNLNLLGDGRNFNSRVFIDDVVNILRLAPDRLIAGQAYNVTDDLAVRQMEFYSELSQATGAKLPNWIPINSVEDRIKLSIHGLRAMSLRMSADKIKKALDYDLICPTFKEGITHLSKLE